MAPLAKVIVKPDDRFITAHLIATRQLHNSKVIIDPQKQVINIIRRLTKLDFPHSSIQIDKNGWVALKSQ